MNQETELYRMKEQAICKNIFFWLNYEKIVIGLSIFLILQIYFMKA